MAHDGVTHDLVSLLGSGDRDFLVRNNGDQVKINTLSGKILGLYFSGSWCGPCRRFTPYLVEVYQELASKGDFEVVFISSDRDEESFSGYFSEMPWLAVPFSDLETRKGVKDLFKVRGIPHLVVIDANGKVCTDQGVVVVREYGVEGYPFTAERISFLKEQEEAAKKDQSLSSLLVSSSRDYLISSEGNKVSVSELEGKLVGLYFTLNIRKACKDFTQTLVKFYNSLKEKGEDFEIVLISLDFEEEHFKEGIAVPWLALPFKDKNCEKLARYFELETVPTLVIIGQDGKTLHPNVTELIEEHGIEAYPFSAEKIAELAEIEKAKLEAQTLESLLVSEDTDFVIETSGAKVPVSELVGKHILLYFSAHWCPPCRSFLPKLITAYHEIKAKDNAFEVIFISSDRDQSSFDDFFSSMPWLALPFGDPRKAFLQRKFKIQGIPAVVAISPTGKTVTTTARKLILAHGADAFPFTEEHLKHLEEKIEQEAKGWPEKVKSELHVEHDLARTRRNEYVCNGCRDSGSGWSFYCKECDFDLHPKCALKNNEATKDDPETKTNGQHNLPSLSNPAQSSRRIRSAIGDKYGGSRTDVPEGFITLSSRRLEAEGSVDAWEHAIRRSASGYSSCSSSLCDLSSIQVERTDKSDNGLGNSSCLTRLKDLNHSSPPSLFSPPESLEDANFEQKLRQVQDEHATLPHHLKRLFLYCSLFPFGYQFSKDGLVQLWIAEGFIREAEGENGRYCYRAF